MIDSHTDFFSHIDSISCLSKDIIDAVFEHVIENAKYTIAITVYKRAAFLKQCLESAIHQDTTIPYEIIVVDDDPIRNNEVQTLMNDYSNVPNLSYYKKTKNEGLMDNMNRSIMLARTDWVLLIHDDDWLCEDYIQKLDNYHCMYPDYTILVPSHTTFYFDKFIETKSSFRERMCKMKGCWRIRPLDFIDGTCATPTGVLYHKDSFIQSGGYAKQYGMAADYVFFAKYSSENKILRINEKLFNYRFAENESLKSETTDNFKVIGHYLSVYLMKRYSWLPKSVCDRYERTRLWISCKSDELEIRRLFGDGVYEEYRKVPSSNFIYRIINFYVKASVFFKGV